MVAGLSTLFSILKKRIPENQRKSEHGYLGYFCEDIIELYLQHIFLQIYSGIDVLVIQDSHSARNTPLYWKFVQNYVINIIKQKMKIPIIYCADSTWHHCLHNVACYGFGSKEDASVPIQNYYGIGGIFGTFNQNYFKLPHNIFVKYCDKYIENLVQKTTSVERSSWVNTTGYFIPESARDENIWYFINKSREIKNEVPKKIVNEMFIRRRSTYEVFVE
jgi:hypothetical protein